MLHFFKVTTFLWIILVLHPNHTSPFLEAVIIKFGGPRTEGRHMGPRAEGRQKQIPSFYDVHLEIKNIDQRCIVGIEEKCKQGQLMRKQEPLFF